MEATEAPALAYLFVLQSLRSLALWLQMFHALDEVSLVSQVLGCVLCILMHSKMSSFCEVLCNLCKTTLHYAALEAIACDCMRLHATAWCLLLYLLHLLHHFLALFPFWLLPSITPAALLVDFIVWSVWSGASISLSNSFLSFATTWALLWVSYDSPAWLKWLMLKGIQRTQSPTCKCFLLFACWSKAWNIQRRSDTPNEIQGKELKTLPSFTSSEEESWYQLERAQEHLAFSDLKLLRHGSQ